MAYLVKLGVGGLEVLISLGKFHLIKAFSAAVLFSV